MFESIRFEDIKNELTAAGLLKEQGYDIPLESFTLKNEGTREDWNDGIEGACSILKNRSRKGTMKMLVWWV